MRLSFAVYRLPGNPGAVWDMSCGFDQEHVEPITRPVSIVHDIKAVSVHQAPHLPSLVELRGFGGVFEFT